MCTRFARRSWHAIGVSGAYGAIGITLLPPILERWRLNELDAKASNTYREVPPRFWKEVCHIATEVGVDAGYRVRAVVVSEGSPMVTGTRGLPHLSCLLVIPASAIDAAETRWGSQGFSGKYKLPPDFRFEIAHEFAHILREDNLLRALLVSILLGLPHGVYIVLRKIAGWHALPTAVAVAGMIALTTILFTLVWRRVELRADRTAAESGFLREGISVLEQKLSRHGQHVHEYESLLPSAHFPLRIRLEALQNMQPGKEADRAYQDEPLHCLVLPRMLTLGFLQCRCRLRELSAE